MEVRPKIPERLMQFGQKRKRFKIMIGGRGSAKSETTAAIFAARVWGEGCRAVCCREFQTSIKQSVHSLVSRKIKDMELGGFDIDKTEITHENGGEIIYQGLARDPEAIKSVDDAKLCWVEEAQSLSAESLKELTPSIRGDGSEVWFTANLKASTDPFSQRFIKPFEKQLRTDRYYEDDLHLIVWINYDENPFFPNELEQERQHDKRIMTDAGYRHKWLGEFLDSVEGAIIDTTWFDSAVDAHIKLGFKPQGMEVVSHDPADSGDAKGLAYRYGNVVLDVDETGAGDINTGGDWAVQYAIDRRADHFVWDGDGLGVGLKRQFGQALDGKRTNTHLFHGAAAVDFPDAKVENEPGKGKTNREAFKNKRAQYYWYLRERFRKTHQAVNGEYIDPEELISLSSDIQKLDLLRSELCSVPQKFVGSGIFQVMSKQEMLRAGIASPNMGDALMMSYAVHKPRTRHRELDYSNINRAAHGSPMLRRAMR